MIPVGVCLGIEDSEGFTFISSERDGATSFGNKPLSDRTYAAISHAWYSGMRLRNAGIPLGRQGHVDEIALGYAILSYLEAQAAA